MCGFTVLGMEGGLGGVGDELGERRHLGNDADGAGKDDRIVQSVGWLIC